MDFAGLLNACPPSRALFAPIRAARLFGISVASILKAVGPVSFLVLGSCAQPLPIIGPSEKSLVSSQTAFAFPAPGGPAITAVLERRFANATQQDILLETSAHTPGQNMLRVQFFGPVDRSVAGESRLREGYLPFGDVGSEIRQVLPGIRMQRSPYYVQNKYGPFGYAVGRSASGDTCLYGWQRISSTGVTQTWVGNKGSIQIRLRLCDQNASEQRLLDTMYGYTITSYFKTRNWNPYGDPAAPEASLGKSGQPIYPVGVSRFETVTTPPAVRAPRRIRSTQRQASTEPAAELPAAMGPIVPPPPGSQSADFELPAATAPAHATPTVPADVAGKSTGPIVPPPPCVPSDETGSCD